MTHPHKKPATPKGSGCVRATSLKRRIAGADPASELFKLLGGRLVHETRKLGLNPFGRSKGAWIQSNMTAALEMARLALFVSLLFRAGCGCQITAMIVVAWNRLGTYAKTLSTSMLYRDFGRSLASLFGKMIGNKTIAYHLLKRIRGHAERSKAPHPVRCPWTAEGRLEK
jgi:hypothetical protein